MRVAAVGWLAFIVFATLSGLSSRPVLVDSETVLITAVERFCAYGVLGFLCGLSFPDRPRLVLSAIIGLAAGLELAQFLVPDRDPRLIDALEKVLGGLAGFVAAPVATSLIRSVSHLRFWSSP
ncbi:VanZ family protein [Bradyrhizobium sp. F1.4.3]|uniref:VanZ family protein n=1 Tax=Bradyrhizobium sp. F1.4.3 TaxID=3156356 RepID=UPI00339A9D23